MTGARRPRSVWAAWFVAGAVVILIVVAVVVWQSSDDDGSDASAVVTAIGAARGDFAGLTAGTITVGGRELRVVIADEENERIQGLRRKSDASPYDGMLFVFPETQLTSFTMATVPDGLEITFYAADGRVVDQLHMEPCPNGTDATCPAYTPKGQFRYALETADGVVYDGRLAVPKR